MKLEPEVPPGEGAGLGARRLALDAVHRVLKARTALDDTLDRLLAGAGLESRDEALARAIASSTFRRLGTLRQALAERLDKGLPRDERLFALLATGAAQILLLDVPDHAAVDSAVRLARAERGLAPFAGLVNAVLRRVAREREAILGEADPLRDAPGWLAARWRARYGEATAAAIALAHRVPAALDLTVTTDAEGWAERLGAHRLPTGSLRLAGRAPLRDLPGYAEGAWWVQDAAAGLPARLLAPKAGERIADLCAAPGGKTAQLLAAGAAVTAVDRSERRMQRLRQNLERLGFTADLRVEDALGIEAEPFDAVLLDAPCSASGTLRRHPDAAWIRTERDLAALVDLQRRLLDKAARLVRPGGRLVYCTCSLEPEEGERQVEAFLQGRAGFRREPVTPAEIGGLGHLVTPEGDLRSLPCHLVDPDQGLAGLDGFFAARLVREPA